MHEKHDAIKKEMRGVERDRTGSALLGAIFLSARCPNIFNYTFKMQSPVSNLAQGMIKWV